MSQSVHIRYFAAAADAAGRDEELVTVSPGATIGQVRVRLAREHGGELGRVLDLCSFLLQGAAADPETVIPSEAGVRVDVLPPFAGG